MGCQVCTEAMGQLENYLEEDSTEEEIIQALERVCDLVQGDLKMECVETINGYTAEIVQSILNKVHPSDVCQYIGLCAAKLKVPSPKDLQCELCKYIAGELDKVLDEDSTKKEIEEAMEQACDQLPSDEQDECRSFIKMYAPQIIEYLLGELTPKSVCKEIGQCSAQKYMKSKPVTDDETCEICKLVATELDQVFDEDSTQKEIEEALENVCNILPSSIKSECDDFIEEYTPQIIQLLEEKLQPESLCKQIGLCTSEKKSKPVSDDENCEICKLVAEELDKLLDEDSTQKEIEDAL